MKGRKPKLNMNILRTMQNAMRSCNITTGHAAINGDIFYDKNEARFCITRLQSVDTNFFCNVNHFVPVPSGYLPNFNTFDIYNRLMRNYVSNLELWVGYLAVADTVTCVIIGGSKVGRGAARDARPPLGVQILSFSCSFWQKIPK